MAQNEITILCTRNIDESLIKDAASKNIFVDVIPFIRIIPVSTKEIKAEIKKALMLPAKIVFTSTNAVEIVAAGIREQKPNWQIFCIGHATRESAEKHFGKNSISGMADHAEALAKIIIEAHVDRLIFFCGDRRRKELPAILKQNNIELREVVVYQSIATPTRTEKHYKGILFFSPSAVKSFFQRNDLDDQTVLFALGNTTAREIKKSRTAGKKLLKNKIIVSDEPEQKSLLEKAVNYFHTNPIHL